MTRRRKNTRRPRRWKRSRAIIPRALADHPSKKIARLRYVQTISLNPGAGGIAVHQFRANSLYDPDLTGVGHQPFGFDQLALQYDHYVVLGSKIKAQYLPTGTSAGQPGQMALTLDDNATFGYSSMDELCEGNQALGFAKMAGYPIGTDRPITLVGKYSAKKFHGVKDMSDNIGRLGAAVGTNPTEDAYFNVCLGSVAASTDPDAYYIQVTLDYIALFTEPTKLVHS